VARVDDFMALLFTMVNNQFTVAVLAGRFAASRLQATSH
jgi:hypothetical protein